MSKQTNTDSKELYPSRADLARRAEKLEDLVSLGIERGLFSRDDNPMLAINAIAEARKLAASGDLESAASKLSQGEHAFHSKVYGRTFAWRCHHMHQFWLLFYYVVGLLLVMNVGTGYWYQIHSAVWTFPMAAVGLGALGAILRGMWWLTHHVERGNFRTRWVLSHLAAPWIGALFGLLTYLLLLAGVVTLEGAASNGDLDQPVVPLALAFLAGYSWEWILERIDQWRSRTKESSKASENTEQSSGDDESQDPGNSN